MNHQPPARLSVCFSRGEPRYDQYGFPYMGHNQYVDEEDLEARADTLLRKSDELSTHAKVRGL